MTNPGKIIEDTCISYISAAETLFLRESTVSLLGRLNDEGYEDQDVPDYSGSVRKLETRHNVVRGRFIHATVAQTDSWTPRRDGTGNHCRSRFPKRVGRARAFFFFFSFKRNAYARATHRAASRANVAFWATPTRSEKQLLRTRPRIETLLIYGLASGGYNIDRTVRSL